MPTRVPTRYAFAQLQAADVDAAYRQCAKFLEARPRAHRVEAWDGGRYVTRATRGVDVMTEEETT